MNSTPEVPDADQPIVAGEEVPDTTTPAIAPENPAIVSFRAMREAQQAVTDRFNRW
jgi:hypothetical protein